MIRKLHHAAWQCRDSEETRAFYEDLLGLPLTAAIPFDGEMKGRAVRVLHSFFELGDGSFFAFFETVGVDFQPRDWSDFELHFAVEVDEAALAPMIARAHERGIEVRGPVDHQIVKSIYLRDPNGYVVELSAKTPVHDAMVEAARPSARAVLDGWQSEKTTARQAA